MNREETAITGFEVVAFAGETRSRLMGALEQAEERNFEQAERLVEEAHTSLIQAHKPQTQMLAAKASGGSVEIGFVMVHAQDHLITAMLLKGTIRHLPSVYRKA